MEDTGWNDQDAKPQAQPRPAWVDEQAEPASHDDRWPPAPRHARQPRRGHVPVPGKQEQDGLWTHVTEVGGIVLLAAWIAAAAMPHRWPLLLIILAMAVITAVIGYVALDLTDAPSMAGYLVAWGIMLTGWMAIARLTSPWKGANIFMLALAGFALIVIGVPVIRRYRDRVNRAADTGRDTVHVRECRYWEGLLARLGVANVIVRDVIRVDGGRQLHCRLGKAAEGRGISAMPDADTARRICVQRRLPRGSVYIEEAPKGLSEADFIIHIRETAGPRLARWLPAENSLLSINRPFPLGVLDTGREWALRLREVVVFICGVIGSGKALDVNTRIATPTGWTTMGEIKAGDLVFDETGQPCRVIAATDVMHGRPCYEVEFSDGTVITADRNHQWRVDTGASRRSARARLRRKPGAASSKGRDQDHLRKRPEILTTRQMIPGLRTLNRSRTTADGGVNNYSVRVAGALQCPDAELPVPPYTLGAWLGDGTTDAGAVTSADPEIITEISREMREALGWGREGAENKHIPVSYLRASEDQRRALLAGLLDTDGHCTQAGTVEFSNTNERLAQDAYHLVCSLGYKATLRSKTARCDGKDCGTAWTVAFTPADKVFRLPRKLARQVTRVRSTAAHRYVTAIRRVPSRAVRCIQVDSPSQLYLAGESCVPTHNSTLLNVFIAQLCRMPDCLIFMIDLKGGMEARAWLMPWVMGLTDRPAIDWLATTRDEAKVMLDALWRGGQARAESGRYGRKLIPGIQKDGENAPAIIVICDETAVMTGHMIREEGISNSQLATRLLQITETFRAVAISPVVAAVRAVVDVTGNSGIKAMSSVRIGLKVASISEGQAIFPDDYQAARQLAALRDKGMGIPKVDAELHPPVHFFNITDGNPDDDGHPTEDRITPVVLATARRRPVPEPLVVAAMNQVRVTVGDRDMGAYDARWEQPHMKQLIDTWRTEAGAAPPPEPLDERPEPQSSDADWDRWTRELNDLDPVLNDAEPGYTMNRTRKRLYEMLIERGPAGHKVDTMWNMLKAEGHEVSRQTLHEWLGQADQQGYVTRQGKPRSPAARWVWRLGVGEEFGIPGWG